MSSETIEDTIQRLYPTNIYQSNSRSDRQMIQERQQERNKLFKMSSQNYLKTIKKEIETIKKTEVIQEQRNNEFKNQINSLYLRYETGTERLKIAMKRTIIEKINYNNYLVKVYPREYTDQKKQLEEENEKLKRKIDEIKRANNAFDYRVQGALNRQQENDYDIDDPRDKIDNIRQQTDDYSDPEVYKRFPEFQPYNYNGNQIEQENQYLHHHHTETNMTNNMPQEPIPQIVPQAVVQARPIPQVGQSQIPQYEQKRQRSPPRDFYQPPASNKTDKLDQFLMQGQYRARESSQEQFQN